MSLLNLKSKKEPKYISKPYEPKRREQLPDVTEEKTKNPINSASSLQVGNGVTITGSIKADNEVTIEGTLDGDVDCHCLMVSKSGNIKGKVKTETMTIEGKAEGEISINELLQIKSTGSVNGKIVYGKIEVDDGGKLIGEINYRDKDNKQEEFKDWKAL